MQLRKPGYVFVLHPDKNIIADFKVRMLNL